MIKGILSRISETRELKENIIGHFFQFKYTKITIFIIISFILFSFIFTLDYSINFLSIKIKEKYHMKKNSFLGNGEKM